MPIIQATTPTNAGWAQSFDTSGVAQIAAQERDRKNKRLQELLTQYDTKGIWDRDTDYIQGKIDEVNDFAMNNAKELANPSKNMKTWQQFQKMQSDVKNSVVYSIGAKERFDKGNQMYNSGNGRYMTDANRELLYSYQNKPTSEQYADKSAFADPTSLFDRNVNLNMNKYVAGGKELVQDLPPEMSGQLAEGVALITKGKALDKNKLKDALREDFFAQSMEGSDLRYKYGEDESGLDAFSEDVYGRIGQSPEYATARTPTKSEKAATPAQLKAENAVVRRSGSGYKATETMFETVTQGKGKNETEYTAPITTGADEQGNEQFAVNTYGVMTVGGQDNTMTFYPNLKISKPLDQGYDMGTGEALNPAEGKDYNSVVPLERSTYVTASMPIDMKFLRDGKEVKYRYKKGEPLPDIVAMKNDGSLSDNEFNRISGLVTQQIGYIVAATKESINFEALGEGEDPMHMLKKAGARFYMVPAEEYDVEVNQQLGYRYGTSLQSYGAAARPKYNIMGNIQ